MTAKYRKSNGHFKFTNANPKGYTTQGDCAIRAIAVTIGMDWKDVVRESCDMAIENGWSPEGRDCIDAMMQKHGYVKMTQPRKKDNKLYTGVEFCKYLAKNGYTENVCAIIGTHHLTSFGMVGKSYKVLDTWDCAEDAVHTWWCKGA